MNSNSESLIIYLFLAFFTKINILIVKNGLIIRFFQEILFYLLMKFQIDVIFIRYIKIIIVY